MAGEEERANSGVGLATIEESGTLASNIDPPVEPSNIFQPKEDSAIHEEDENALNWYEVIELKTLSERKVWIEEKIKFLEGLPPVEVFAGLDAVRSSAEEVPGLPTREQLREWLEEHDRIEKETEIFDSGELKKLRKFTKAAAQRNLSLADTDLIEITLTTILALDKLFHLLRDRSDNLELLGIRLTWEERRVAARIELRSMIADLRDFLDTRARWSPSAYDVAGVVDEPSNSPVLKRKGSLASIASAASDASYAGVPRLAHNSRLKLAGDLTREAAQLATRVSSLKRSKIAGAGKALDKLIDHSRKPIPDELLDEQDRLENRANEMEDVGKFIMSVVIQWKKADEFYVETLKDKTNALTLLEEIEVASMHHPTARQDAAFLSHSTGLAKRLTTRANPAFFSTKFPRPTHHLYPGQPAATQSIVQILLSELASATEQAKKVEACAKEYHVRFEAVKNADVACKAASDVSATFVSLLDHMQNGVATTSGDGTPPDLSTEACLDVNLHATFLAILPATIQEFRKADEDATKLLPGARAALLSLDRPDIDEEFKMNSASVIDALASHRDAASHACQAVTARVSTLTNVRQIWSAMGQLFQELEGIRNEIPDAMERQMWRQQVRSNGAPPTPETPTAELPPLPVSPASVLVRLDTLQVKLNQEVVLPFHAVVASIGTPLKTYMSGCSTNLSSFLTRTNELVRFWESVLHQAAVMGNVRDEVHGLQIQMEELKIQFDRSIQCVLAGELAGDDLLLAEGGLTTELKRSQDTVEAFLADLPHRVPFVGHLHGADVVTAKRSSPSGNFSLDDLQQAAPLYLPFDPAVLDNAVRVDSNSYSMMLSGVLEGLEQKADHFHLAKVAKTIDLVTASLVDSIHHAVESISSIQQSATEIPVDTRLLDHLTQLIKEVEQLSSKEALEIARSFSPIRDLLHRLKSTPGNAGASVRESLVMSRQRVVEEAEAHFSSWKDAVVGVQQQLAKAQDAERSRLVEEGERLRMAEEARLKEKERLEAEERARQERERVERLARIEEERLRREQLETEERERAEQERLRAQQDAERQRLEAEKARLERLAAEKREVAELQRLEAEEKVRQEAARKRFQAEEKAREVAERQRLEAEEKARQEAERQRLEERARAERQRLAEEKARFVLEETEAAERKRIELGRAEVDAASRLDKEVPWLHEAATLREKQPRAITPLEDIREEDSVLLAAVDDQEDVFGGPLLPSPIILPSSQKRSDFHTRIYQMRERLHSIHISDVARPSLRSDDSLPSDEKRQRMANQLSATVTEVALFPPSITDDPATDTDLRSLRSEVTASNLLMQTVHKLADFCVAVGSCDAALSDLLEHIDSYPAPPIGPLSSSYTSNFSMTPEEQLSDRLSFTRGLLDKMQMSYSAIADDSRVASERDRVLQTWSELEAMGLDRVNGQNSRPPSVISSGSSGVSSSAHRSKKSSYAKNSVSSADGFLVPPVPQAKRISTSASATPHARLTSRASVALSARSVSGPIPSRSSSRVSSNRTASGTMSSSSTLYGSTFSSRQRTTSTSSAAPSMATPVKRAQPTTRPRAQSGHADRTASPALSETPLSRFRPRTNSSLSATPRSTWSRAPRQSLPAVAKAASPPPVKPTPRENRPYVPNPKNKLDVAVGDVLNKLPVRINVEVVADTWKDQSGKYWIGDTEPKLCFCRILRSQAVMVRVGGGWSELSKFIKEHFADAFRILPESPPQALVGLREEKWISSATLSQVAENMVPFQPPSTPPPNTPFIPALALSTPGGTSPKSIRSSSPSSGSPRLTALQFIRKFDRESPSLRPESPSRSSRSVMSMNSVISMSSVLSTSASSHPPVWRP